MFPQRAAVFLGQTNQLVVVGFCLALMVVGCQKQVSLVTLQYSVQSGRASLQELETILQSQFFIAESSIVCKAAIFLLTAVPLALSVGYKRCVGGSSTVKSDGIAYNELWTQNEMHDLLEKLSGERITRKYAPAAEYEQKVDAVIAELEANPKDPVLRVKKVYNQYCLSVGIRGENTPEYAQYLGYLDGKQLYPDVKFTSYEDYLQEVLDGKAVGV